MEERELVELVNSLALTLSIVSDILKKSSKELEVDVHMLIDYGVFGVPKAKLAELSYKESSGFYKKLQKNQVLSLKTTLDNGKEVSYDSVDAFLREVPTTLYLPDGTGFFTSDSIEVKQYLPDYEKTIVKIKVLADVIINDDVVRLLKHFIKRVPLRLVD